MAYLARLAAAGMIVVCAFPAFAADAVAVTTSTTSQIWFGNALQAVAIACAAPISAILCAMLWKLAAKFGVQASAADQAKLNDETKAALTVGAVKAADLIAARGWDHVDVHNQVLADAATYFLQRFPDRATAIAEQAGVAAPAVPSAAKDTAIKETLMARLPDAMNEAAASPATPPVPAVPATVINLTTEAAAPAPAPAVAQEPPAQH
jgi:hypothetical protein